jgi:transformation/transcription domain-associated protein
VNRAYLPLVNNLNAANGSPQQSSIYRGYHEIAWIINRFAHVARKHQLADVCTNSLTKIYTLPNIEVHEAAFKLQEHAKCHLYLHSDYAAGLEVINNTNLGWFSQTQKADFFVLKGQFFASLNRFDDASDAFSTALQLEKCLPNAWASWGEFNDRLFAGSDPVNIKNAADAINCYLHAAGLPGAKRPRQYLARVLWLISLDDEAGTLQKSFEAFKGEIPVWHWVAFIPQLLSSLSGKESNITRGILSRIAKAHPQALHFQLKTAKEEFNVMRRQYNQSVSTTGKVPETPNSEMTEAAPMTLIDENKSSNPTTPVLKDGSASAQAHRKPWEFIDELSGLLKTAFPLLALSMEAVVEQILQRLKPTTDEDIYRLIVALLTDGVQVPNL